MKIISILLVFGLSVCAHAEMYKWVDAEGNITYSDRPQPDSNSGSEEVSEITIPPVNTADSVDTSVLRETNSSKQPDKATAASIKITKPKDDEAIRENMGNVSINVAVKPQSGNHTIAVYIDGNEVSRGSATSVSLQNVDRGTHVITAELISPEGKVINSASPVTFHLQRYRIPNRVVAPR